MAEKIESRHAMAALLYSSGATLTEVGEVLGVGRERARQLARSGGYEGRRYGGSRVDPLKVCRAIDEGLTVEECATKIGCSTATVIHVLQAFGKYKGYRAGLRGRRVERRKLQLLRQMWDVANEIGRTPGQLDLQAAGLAHTPYYVYFGGLTKAQELAGLIPNAIGKPQHIGNPLGPRP